MVKLLCDLEPLENCIHEIKPTNAENGNGNGYKKDMINRLKTYMDCQEDEDEHEEYREILEYLKTEEFIEYIYNIVLFECVYELHEPEFMNKWYDVIDETLENEYMKKDTKHQYKYDDITEVINELDIFKQWIIDKVINILEYTTVLRSHKNSVVIEKNSQTKERYKEIIDKLNMKNESLPQQRTKEWYYIRYNALSASNLWKLLHTDASKEQLIKEKIGGLNMDKYSNVNMNSTLHWGQKYEPISQMYYEYTYDTQIEEYSCILHDNYECIGASPDGINIKHDNVRYGRLLEIKNIINRDITGIPKKEYWIQTQIQMECCDLDECDFLECRFKEYTSFDEFQKDTEIDKNKKDNVDRTMYTKTGKHKGVFMCFLTKERKPHYEYFPFGKSIYDIDTWQDEKMEYCERLGMNWLITTYWYLEEVSCVLIERNKLWFQSVLPNILDTWNTILERRENTNVKSESTIKVNKINTLKFKNVMTKDKNKDKGEKYQEEEKKNKKKDSVNIIEINI